MISDTYYLRRAKMLELLGELENTGDVTASTVYLPAGLSADMIQETLRNAGGESGFPEGLAGMIGALKNGAVLFWSRGKKYLASPPFPLREQVTCGGFVTGLLVNLLKVDYMIGLVLVHLGVYAVGLCQGEKLVTSKVGTGLVHGRHKKGGSSQQRFQRRRENQATEFLGRVCLHAREQFESRAELIDYVVYGGPRQTLMQLQGCCPFLRLFADRVLLRLDVPDPRREILEKAVGRIWSSRITEWREEV